MRYTIESFTQRLQNYFPDSDFTLLNYDGIKYPLNYKCNLCGKVWHYSTADHVVNRYRTGCKSICPDCEENHIWEDQRKKALHKMNHILEEKGTISLVSEVRILREPVVFHCSKCNKNFERTPTQFINKNSKCPWCEGHFQKKTLSIIKEQILEQFGNEYTVLTKENEGWDSSKTNKIKVRHNKCGFIYNVNFNSIVRGHGCPRCKASLGEQRVRKYLQKNGFVFQEQYSFLESEIRTLKFDFYLEEHGKQYCIEYNGIQHYSPVEQFGGEEAFILQQQRDNRKAKYCKENNIELIIIPYNDEHLIKTQELAQRLNGEKLS